MAEVYLCSITNILTDTKVTGRNSSKVRNSTNSFHTSQSFQDLYLFGLITPYKLLIEYILKLRSQWKQTKAPIQDKLIDHQKENWH
ncbi:hypothetical protein Fmac_011103 [Flemingia macrophylla]|uniref:Uncharacterized protein n=1 Tax=Flemingia macrophylla TaxID=520843 RepID=A0ABD1MLG7_9FABA